MLIPALLKKTARSKNFQSFLLLFLKKILLAFIPKARVPLTYVNDWEGRGGGGGGKIFLGLRFWHKRNVLEVFERRRDIYGYCIFNNNINTIYCTCGTFWGMLKKVGIFMGFMGRQILETGIFLVIKY